MSASKEKLHYVRHVPKFLRGYAHLLNTNKKNYMNEEVGYDDVTREGFQTELELEEDGAVIVRPERQEEKRGNGEEQNFGVRNVRNVGEKEEEDEEELTEVPSMSDYFPETKKGVTKEKNDEELDEKEYYQDGKIIFHGGKGKKRINESDKGEDTTTTGAESAVSVDETKTKSKPKSKKAKTLLSFDEEF